MPPLRSNTVERISSTFTARTGSSRFVSTTMVRPVLGRMISEAARPARPARPDSGLTDGLYQDRVRIDDA
jgi:hypothetical protein